MTALEPSEKNYIVFILYPHLLQPPTSPRVSLQFFVPTSIRSASFLLRFQHLSPASSIHALLRVCSFSHCIPAKNSPVYRFVYQYILQDILQSLCQLPFDKPSRSVSDYRYIVYCFQLSGPVSFPPRQSRSNVPI